MTKIFGNKGVTQQTPTNTQTQGVVTQTKTQQATKATQQVNHCDQFVPTAQKGAVKAAPTQQTAQQSTVKQVTHVVATVVDDSSNSSSSD